MSFTKYRKGLALITKEDGNIFPVAVDLLTITAFEPIDTKETDEDCVEGIALKVLNETTELLFKTSVLFPNMLYLGVVDDSWYSERSHAFMVLLPFLYVSCTDRSPAEVFVTDKSMPK